MRNIGIVIIGAGLGGSSVYYNFNNSHNVKIMAIVDIAGEGSFIEDALSRGVEISSTVEEVVLLEGIDVIIETTNEPEIVNKVHNLKRDEVRVVDASCLQLMLSLGHRKETTEATLKSALSSVKDAVQIIDKDGVITFCNEEYEKMAGLSPNEWLGQNAFVLYPNSPMVKALQSQCQVSGQNYSLNKNGIEVHYSISPVMVRGQFCGIIAVYRVVPEIIKLMEELQRSTSIIEVLYDRLAEVSGFNELDLSNIVTIDKMEKIMLKQALAKYGYSVEGKRRAAETLNISLATLYNKLKKYEMC